jgi:AhpC/TSA family
MAACKVLLPPEIPAQMGDSMKRKIALGLLAAASLASAPAVPQAEKSEVAKMTLKVGDTAPDFTLLSDGWKTVKLSDYRGKKNVFLAVYVLAFTGG